MQPPSTVQVTANPGHGKTNIQVIANLSSGYTPTFTANGDDITGDNAVKQGNSFDITGSANGPIHAWQGQVDKTLEVIGSTTISVGSNTVLLNTPPCTYQLKVGASPSDGTSGTLRVGSGGNCAPGHENDDKYGGPR